MGNVTDILNKLLGKIFLKKPVFFGLDEQKITLIISPSMKIFGIYASPERLANKFPFEEKTFLNTKELISWSKDNGFEVTFSADTPRLKQALFSKLGDVMVESVEKNKEKELSVIVLEELNNSKLPDSIKEWANQNPEKFIQNLKHVQNILKK